MGNTTALISLMDPISIGVSRLEYGIVFILSN
jgi:hypothetical protein